MPPKSQTTPSSSRKTRASGSASKRKADPSTDAQSTPSKKKKTGAAADDPIDLEHDGAGTGDDSPDELDPKPKKGPIKGDERKVPCSQCFDKFRKGTGTGVCHDQLSASARCWRCNTRVCQKLHVVVGPYVIAAIDARNNGRPVCVDRFCSSQLY